MPGEPGVPQGDAPVALASEYAAEPEPGQDTGSQAEADAE